VIILDGKDHVDEEKVTVHTGSADNVRYLNISHTDEEKVTLDFTGADDKVKVIIVIKYHLYRDIHIIQRYSI
jgi:hypothetical protein